MHDIISLFLWCNCLKVKSNNILFEMRTYILRNADFQEVEKLNDLWNHSDSIAEVTLDQYIFTYVLSMGLPSKCQPDQGDGPIL